LPPSQLYQLSSNQFKKCREIIGVIIITSKYIISL